MIEAGADLGADPTADRPAAAAPEVLVVAGDHRAVADLGAAPELGVASVAEREHPAAEPARRQLAPDRDGADAVAGRGLVLTASCGSLLEECRASWAPAVDAIVTGSLDFHGYNTIDPATLRKDERERREVIATTDDRTATESASSSGEIGVVGIIPIAAAGSSSSSSVTVTQTRHKTVELTGAASVSSTCRSSVARRRSVTA